MGKKKLFTSVPSLNPMYSTVTSSRAVGTTVPAVGTLESGAVARSANSTNGRPSPR